MNKRTHWIAALFVTLVAPFARAGERFVVVPFSALKFDDPAPVVNTDEGPSLFESTLTTHEPYVVLDAPGEVYVDFVPDASWNDWLTTPTRIAMRVDTNTPLSGRLFIALSRSEGFTARRFHIDDAPEEANARTIFYATMEAHYQRLRDAGLPGAAWFRHQIAVSRAARGLAASDLTTTNDMPGAREEDFDATFDLFTGERALAENLDLDRVLRGIKNEDESIDVASIDGVTTRAMDWKALVKDLKPELDALAKFIPADQHAAFLPSFDALVRVVDELDRSGTPILEFASSRGEDQRTKERYQTQLCLPLSAVARMLGSTMVSSVALTGSDPLFPSGTDVAVLFDCKQPDAMRAYLALRHTEAKTAGAKVVEGVLGSVKYAGVRSEDRRICSYVAQIDNTIVVTNSLAQLERILATRDGQVAPLASADEYVWFRDRYKKSDASESALIVLTDATIRRWAGPRARIGDSRRVRAAAAMSEMQARQLDALVAGKVTAGMSAADTDLPFSADFVWGPRGVRSERWGSLEFLTPLAEIPIERVTPSEKQAYENFRRGFQSRWRDVFDPIALRLTFTEQKLAADLTVMPLVLSSAYREFSDLTRDAKLAPSAGDAHDNTLFHLAFAFGRQSELSQMFAGAVGPFAQQLGADPLGWIGGGIAIYADRDAFWDELVQARDRSLIMRDSFYRMPIALHVEVKDPLKLAVFLTAVRAMIDGAAPGMTRWENKTWHEQGYVRIGVESSADIPEAMSEAALYYAPMGDSLVLSLREDVVQRAIDRRLARKAGKPEAAREKAWLGSSIGLRAEKDALDVIGGIWSSQFGDSLKSAAWSALPILNEWKRRYPSEDPVALHERLWGVRLTTPGDGTFVWNDAMQTMEASDYGSPAAPKTGPRLPHALDNFLRAEFGLSFEGEGLRARVELERAVK